MGDSGRLRIKIALHPPRDSIGPGSLFKGIALFFTSLNIKLSVFCTGLTLGKSQLLDLFLLTACSPALLALPALLICKA